MSEYGLSLSDALDVPSPVAIDLLRCAVERKKNEIKFSFIQAENLANLIQIKVSELLTGKKVNYDKPYEDAKVPLAKITDNQINQLAKMSRL